MPRVRRIEPRSAVRIEYPIAPTSGIAKFRFEGPPVGPPIHQLCRIILARRSQHLQADAHQRLFPPLHILLHWHRWSALEIYRYSRSKIHKARAIEIVRLAGNIALEVPYSIGESGIHVGRAAEKIERMIVAQDRHAVGSRRTGNRSSSVEINAAVEERVRHDNRIEMQWGDEICAGRQVLRPNWLP